MSTEHKQRGAGGQVRDRGHASGQHPPGNHERRQQELDAADLADQEAFGEDDGRGLPGSDDVRSDRNDDERNECR